MSEFFPRNWVKPKIHKNELSSFQTQQASESVPVRIGIAIPIQRKLLYRILHPVKQLQNKGKINTFTDV